MIVSNGEPVLVKLYAKILLKLDAPLTINNNTKFNLLTLSNLELTLDDVPLFHTLWHQSHPKIVTPTTYDCRQQEAAEHMFY